MRKVNLGSSSGIKAQNKTDSDSEKKDGGVMLTKDVARTFFFGLVTSRNG